MTLDEVMRRIETTHPDLKPARGALSAIERGHRGVSDELLEALTAAYDLPSGALMTDYRPRSHRHADSPTGARGVQEVAA
jgi:transcriptional regulator with XRE-family HTH domain